jgi:hypothetical protein
MHVAAGVFQDAVGGVAFHQVAGDDEQLAGRFGPTLV